MKILWIDDLKGDENTTPIDIVTSVSSYFKGFLDQSPQEDLDRLRTSEGDEIQRILRPPLKRNSHPIHWYDGFVNGLNAIVKESFDFIILDANLPIDKESLDEQRKEASSEIDPETDRLIAEFRDKKLLPSENINSEELQSENIDSEELQSEDMKAGFILYFYLVQEQGFPRNRVVFLSANAGEADKTLEKFSETKTIPPEVFSKNPKNKDSPRNKEGKKFLDTLDEFSKNEHLNLRRGILDVLIQIEKRPTKPPFEENSGDPVNGVAFVNGLRFLLKDHRIPSAEEIQHFYLALCDYLIKPFERFDGKEVYYKGKHSYKRPCTKEELEEFNKVNSDKEDTECTRPTTLSVDKKYIIPAFLVRNWIAHSLMSSPKSKWETQDVGFLFMTVVRSLFGYEDSYKYFEPLYSSVNKSLIAEKVVEKVVGLQKQHYSKSQGVFDQLSFKGRKDLNLGWPEEDFVGHLYTSFLFCCFTQRFETPKQVSYKDPKDPQGKLVYRSSYWINYRYDFKGDSDPLFELLKAIAYQRIEEREF